MRIGIIGSGNIGGTLTRRLSGLGHEVAVANTRGPDSLAGLAAETGATAATPEEASAGAGLVVIAVPLRAVPDLPDLAGKIVVDANRYYPGRDGRIEAIEGGAASSRWVAGQLRRRPGGQGVQHDPVVAPARTRPPGRRGRPDRAPGRGRRRRGQGDRHASSWRPWASTPSMPATSTTAAGRSPAPRSTAPTSMRTAPAPRSRRPRGAHSESVAVAPRSLTHCPIRPRKWPMKRSCSCGG